MDSYAKLGHCLGPMFLGLKVVLCVPSTFSTLITGLDGLLLDLNFQRLEIAMFLEELLEFLASKTNCLFQILKQQRASINCCSSSNSLTN